MTQSVPQAQLHNSVYSKFMGIFLNKSSPSKATEVSEHPPIVSFGLNILPQTEEVLQEQEEGLPLKTTRRIKLTAPHYPSFVVGELEGSPRTEKLDSQNNFVTDFEGEFEGEKLLSAKLVMQCLDFSSKGFEDVSSEDINSVIKDMDEVKHSVTVFKDIENKGRRPISIVINDSKLSNEKLSSSVRTEVGEQIGDVADLEAVVVLDEVPEDYDWETAENIVKGNITIN